MTISRRAFCGCLVAAGTFAATATNPAAAQNVCPVFTKEKQKATTPDQAIAMLKEGNERMLAGRPQNCDLALQVKDTAAGQAPFAVVLGCIDSRVSPELVFDQGLGDVFCARVAGNIVNTDILGSIEYATKVVGAKAVVVVGHNYCGAIKSAVDGARLGNITALLRNMRPAIATVTAADGPRTSSNAALVQKVAEANARIAADNLTRRSRILRELVAAGDLKIQSAMHDITTGRVTWMS